MDGETMGIRARRTALMMLAAGTLSLNGVLRGSGDLARLETEGEATGSRVTTGRGLDAVLADGERSGAGTLVWLRRYWLAKTLSMATSYDLPSSPRSVRRARTFFGSGPSGGLAGSCRRIAPGFLNPT